MRLKSREYSCSGDFQPGHAAFVQLLKERTKPVRVLVVNGDGFFELLLIAVGCDAHQSLAFQVPAQLIIS
jgi:hypothetical protein